jgi:Fanconi anemia group M protein
MLRDFTPRLYQQTILGTAATHNTLVVLPTGLGKTGIALLLSAQRLLQYPNSKILMLAPTKPLCDQHAETFRKHLDIAAEKIVVFTGSVSPEKREQLWKEAQIIISTPQGLENDLINRRIKLEETSLLIFDEAHHATGEYAYVWLAQQYEKLAKYPRILGLTASPGSDMESIKQICANLLIEKVEVRTEKDPDVSPYVQQVRMKWIEIDFPESYKSIQKHLQNAKKTKLEEVHKYGYCNSVSVSKGELLGIQGELQKKVSSGEKEFEALRSMSLIAEALKIEHALELLETQGVKQLNSYLLNLQKESLSSKTKAVKNLVMDENFKSAVVLTEKLINEDAPNLKLSKLKEIVSAIISNSSDAKIIVFTQFRDSAEQIIAALNEVNISNHIFVGQSKKNGIGFSQKQQKEILDQFRNGEFNTLVATSVAEEGLDIPKVDQVIFFEPIPSAIRSIQRRGRTGRLEKGEVLVLVTKGTRDEAYRWSSHHKEKRMFRNLSEVKKEFSLSPPEKNIPKVISPITSPQPSESNTSLMQFVSENNSSQNYSSSETKITSEPVTAILADHREKNNRIVKELIELGISVKTAQLECADYLVSGRVGVELKQVPDFVASIIDGRLLQQVRELKKNFERAVVIIEGEEDIYSVRKVHANAIRGMLASIVLDFGVPVLYTKNPKDTAGLLAVMAQREQNKERDFSLHERKPHSAKEQQEFFVSALPSIGIQTARLLLEHFETIKNLVNASREEITSIKGVGDKTADKLLNIFEEKYVKK